MRTASYKARSSSFSSVVQLARASTSCPSCIKLTQFNHPNPLFWKADDRLSHQVIALRTSHHILSQDGLNSLGPPMVVRFASKRLELFICSGSGVMDKFEYRQHVG